ISVKATAQHLSAIASRWPKDLVRPEHVSVQRYLQNRTEAKAQFTEENVNALYSLLDNRYSKKYPLAETLRYPASMPNHYDELLHEFAEAPHRGLWNRITTRVKGMFRLK
ncbi:hypothetical protein KEM55_000724, partial [Ascosphaera atra]